MPEQCLQEIHNAYQPVLNVYNNTVPQELAACNGTKTKAVCTQGLPQCTQPMQAPRNYLVDTAADAADAEPVPLTFFAATVKV